MRSGFSLKQLVVTGSFGPAVLYRGIRVFERGGIRTYATVHMLKIKMGPHLALGHSATVNLPVFLASGILQEMNAGDSRSHWNAISTRAYEMVTTLWDQESVRKCFELDREIIEALWCLKVTALHVTFVRPNRRTF